MIGPGWMPSRPRPLGRVRRGLLLYTARRRRRRTAPRAAQPAPPDGRTPGCHPDDLRFDVVPADLPTATLLPGAAHARHRVIGVHLRRWLGDRWSWLRPRTVPMLVAFVGMLAVLGSTTYLSSFALDTPRLAPITRHANPPHTCRHRLAPAAVQVAPAAPAHPEVAISLAP